MRRPDYRWVILAIGFAILFFNGGARSALGLMLKPMGDELLWSRSVLSSGATVYMIVSAMAMPFVGRLADRYDLRWIMGFGAATGAIGIGLLSIVQEPWQFFAVYGLVFALGNAGMSNPVVSVMIVRWFPDRRGLANSVAVSGNAIGQLIIVGLLSQSLVRFGWRLSYGALGLANLAILAPLVMAAVRTAPSRPTQPEELSPGTDAQTPVESVPQTSLLASRQMWLLVLVYSICGFQDFLVATHVVAFALDVGVGTLVAGNLLALMGLMGLLGVLTSGYLADLLGPGRPTLVCFVMRIGIFSLILLSQSQPAVMAFALLYGFTFLMTAPLTVMFSGNIFGSARLGRISGTISAIHQVFGGLGALAGALSFDIWGSYERAWILLLTLSIVATAATLLVRDRAVPRQPGLAMGCCG